jgi:Flp pilus assembly protein TadG
MRLMSFLSRFRRNQKGATAIEFAIVALPFFTMLFAIIEHSMLYFGTQALDNAMMQTSRLIRTGQAQSQGLSQAEFRDLVCAEINFLMSCDDRLAIDVRVFNNFNGVDPESPLNEEGEFADDLQFDPGNSGEIVLVRIFYSWPLLTPFFSDGLATMGDGNRMLQASAAFRNEPF